MTDIEAPSNEIPLGDLGPHSPTAHDMTGRVRIPEGDPVLDPALVVNTPPPNLLSRKEMDMKCLDCGTPLPAQIGRGARRKRCEDCSPRRVRPQPPVISTEGAVYEATVDVLTEADRMGSPLGATALVLAARLDGGDASAAGMASLAKQFTATLALVVENISVPVGKLAELRAHAAKRFGGEL